MTERLLRLPQVQQKVPSSRSQLYGLISQKKFPRPIKLGLRAVAWRESDIEAWIADRIKEAK